MVAKGRDDDGAPGRRRGSRGRRGSGDDGERQDAARRRPQVREEVGQATHGGGGEIRARGSVPGAGMEGAHRRGEDGGLTRLRRRGVMQGTRAGG